MLSKSAIVCFAFFAVFLLQYGYGLICYSCEESKKNPQTNNGGSCYAPNQNTTIKGGIGCEYCQVAILLRENQTEDDSGNVLFYNN
jgi:hypothetical protein